jgi:hypothetical protein
MLLAATATAQSRTPINDLGSGSYLGQFKDVLYENGSNVVPFDHAADGLAYADLIRPLDTNGNCLPNGKIVMISLGIWHPSQDFCAEQNPAPCESWSFIGQATADPITPHSSWSTAPQTADTWLVPSRPNYDYLRDRDLASAAVTEAQVQVAWVANPQPTVSLPASDAGRTACSAKRRACFGR